METNQFSWVKTHQDIVEWLKIRQDNQREIIKLLKDAGINVVEDRDSQGNTYSMEVMDPFTFFCHLYKSKTRLKYMQEIAKRINSFPIPTGEDGIPSANALTARIFPVRDKRTDEIDRLWNFFFAAIEERLNDDLFKDMLSIPGIAPTKLSELLFYVKPDKYLCINGPTKPYIKDVLGISPEFETYSEYINILNRIKAKTSDPFYKISIDGWYYTEKNKFNYWVFQCNPKIYDIMSALRELSTTHWRVSQHVNEIKKGDKVILWVTGPDSGCYALGEVISDVVYDVKDIEEQRFYKDDTYNESYNRVKIKILNNLVDRPILKSQISGINALSDLKAGLQGTNFKATKAQYDALSKLAEVIIEIPVDPNPPIDLSNKSKPLNVILYGPPGTGKTYSTVNKALEILGIDLKGKRRSELKAIFNEKLKSGQIAFVTFHQSMSYEDFIEGIKPKTENEAVLYGIQDGIFKTLCRYASKNSQKIIPSSELQSTLILGIKEDDFRKLYNDYVMKLPDSSQYYSDETFETKTGKREALYKNSNNAIVIRPQSSNQDMILTYERFRRAYFDKAELDHTYIPLILKRILEGLSQNFEKAYTRLIDDLKDLGDKVMKIKTPNGTEFGISINSKGNLNVHTAPEFKLSVTLTKENLKAHAFNEKVPPYDIGYFHGVINLLKTRYGYGDNNKDRQNFVLIIDEINRGNVAQIFGELITLIEEDKRLGKPEALEITLPYSKERLGVPPNLYIIGTMNTADRSVEALDTALRRRFEFEEIPPLYSIVGDNGEDLIDREIDGVNLSYILRKINTRIEKLLEKDHLIGHSYLMQTHDVTELKQAFDNKIIPLLQEYFYGDPGKIGLVLGRGFIERVDAEVEFAPCDYEIDDLQERPVYRLKELSQDEFLNALREL